jgi:hypothetical protein
MNPKLKLLIAILSIGIIIFVASIFLRNNSSNLEWFTNKEVLAPAVYQNLKEGDLKLINDFEEAVQLNSELLFQKKDLLNWQDLVVFDKSNKQYELNSLSQEYKDYIVARWNKIKMETGSDHTKVELFLEKEYESMGAIKPLK